MTDEDFMLLGEWREDAPNHGALILPVDDEGRLLLQLRDHRPSAVHPGLWGLFGGKAEPGETLPEVAVREFEEETGIQITAGQITPFARILSDNDQWRLYCFTMPFQGSARDIRLGEGAGFGFIRPQDVNQLNMVPFAQDVIAAWLKALKVE
jgi:8-oxo-dGTP pyrophosphatase MutT (NUDIX family)